MSEALLKMALQALEEPEALPVLGDLVQELGWFDPRVMQVMWPLGKAPRHGWTTKKKRDRAKIDREAAKAVYPHMFDGFAAKPTAVWARAIGAVLLFGGWRKRKWPLIAQHEESRVMPWRNVSITINGIEFGSRLRDVTYSLDSAPRFSRVRAE